MQKAPKFLNWKTETIELFIQDLTLTKSQQTIDGYRYDVQKFLEYAEEIRRPSALKRLHVVEYLCNCKQAGKSDASINRYYMSIKAYCKFLKKQKIIADDLTEEIKAPKVDQKAPKIPSKNEIEMLLLQPNVETESGLRDRAILEILYSSGLRVSELCDLELDHINEDGITISCGKRAKTRTVPITAKAYEWAQLYISEHRGIQKGYLFQSIMNKQLSRQLVAKIIENYSNKAGIMKITPHTLRHACATHLLNAGADLRLIQEILGHASISSTQRYTHLSTGSMREMFNKFHPRG